VRLTLVECCSVPLVPVIVNVYVAAGVLLPVETVNVEFAGDGGKVTEAGFNVQVACDGHPVTVRFTVPVNPLNAVTVVV
jgi:hypothetical protein